jgi:hypothetical protein
MPNVRIPQAAKKLLPFCKPWQSRFQNACFATYADLVMFAVGVGFGELKGARAPECREFIDDGQPYPIDFSVFKSPGQQLYPLVLLVGLASAKSREVVRDDEQLTRLIENLAAVGFQKLSNRLAATTPEEFHVELARMLLEVAE